MLFGRRGRQVTAAKKVNLPMENRVNRAGVALRFIRHILRLAKRIYRLQQ